MTCKNKFSILQVVFFLLLLPLYFLKQYLMRLNRLLYALLLVITMQSFSLAQEREVSGSVKDASGEPLFGAAVMVEGGR